MEQMLLAKQDEAGVLLTDEQNDFLFADALRMEEIKELSANICLMTIIQPANINGSSNDSAFLSEVQTPSNSYVNPLFAKDNQEQKYPTQPKTINKSIGADQIDSNIRFDEPNENVTSGTVENNNNVQESYALEQLARNAYKEAEKQQIIAKQVQQQNIMLTKQLELYKEKVRVFEITKDNNTTYFNEYIKADQKAKRFEQEQTVELQKTQSILKRKISKNKDQYHDTILNLKAKVKKNVDMVLKIGNSLQGMFILGSKPVSFYDSKLKHGLGYANPYTLMKAISQNLKLYDASCLDDSKIHMNARDTEDILEDATKSQIKMKNKMKDPVAIQKKQNVCTIDYNKSNALYDYFVPQKELSDQQKYFPSSFISSEDPLNESLPYSSSETKPTKKSMPSANPILVDLNRMENDFKKLFELLEMASKRESIFYTSPEEIQLSDFCQQQLKPILQEMQFNETWKQNELLKHQLLEATLKHEIECCVLLSHECGNNNMQDEIKKVQRDSIELQEGLSAMSSVRRPSNRDPLFKNSVISNTKNSSEKVEVSAKTNNKPDVASKNVALNTIVTNDEIKNALIAKNVLCVSCDKNVLIPFSKTRFSVRTVHSKFIDTTPVVSKAKIDAVTTLSDKNKVVQIVLWIVDSGCSKHMTGLGHNLFSVGQFCNGDLEVAFRSKTCYVQNLEGDDLLTGDRESNLYTISITDMDASSPVCLMSKATSTKSWLWHRRLSHLNFGTINDLTKHDLVDGLLKFKYGKDHLCSACEQGKSKKSSHPSKLVPSTHFKLELVHMDLCG
ncbi:integrase, catalytic region, zinc finger, CCHC-type containing protein [Tanacetum coccineum]